MLHGKSGLVGAGESPDLMAAGEQVPGQGAADAAAGTGEDKVHGGKEERRNLGEMGCEIGKVEKLKSEKADN
jgi:hypothetical protein